MKKTIAFLLILLAFQQGVFAAVNFVANDDISKKKQSVNEQKKKLIKPEQKLNTIEQYHIEGYVNSRYVRFIVDVANDQIVNGQMIETNGTETYVHGEFVNDVLHLYDGKGGHFTVIIPNK